VDIDEPIEWQHNQGFTWPVIQVYDHGAGSYSGVLADESYDNYEVAQGISISDTWVTVEIVDENTVHIYTSITNGTIVGVF
jgi:hypothetical protein